MLDSENLFFSIYKNFFWPRLNILVFCAYYIKCILKRLCIYKQGRRFSEKCFYVFSLLNNKIQATEVSA